MPDSLPSIFWLIRHQGGEEDWKLVSDAEVAAALEQNDRFEVVRCGSLDHKDRATLRRAARLIDSSTLAAEDLTAFLFGLADLGAPVLHVGGERG